MKIKTQLVFGIITVIILSIATTTYVHVKDARDLLLNEIDEKGRLVISYLAGVSIDPLIKRDEITLLSYINKAAETPGIAYIMITDSRKRVVASTDAADIGKNISDFSEKITGSTGVIDIMYGGEQRSVINFTKELIMKTKDGDINVGGISAGFNKEYVDERIMGIYLKSGVIGLGICLLSILFVMALADRIIKPLNTLIEGTEIIAEGHLKYKIKVNVRNEFQSLANSFNSMTDKINDYYDGVLNAFTMALDQKDKYSPGHGKRVANLAVELAVKINLKPRQVENIRIASILKDIGNIAVDGSILAKKDALSPDDLIKIQKHPEIGAKILNNIAPLKDVIPIILQHHERYDGLGYPNGLKGDEISKEAKILAIVDAYDAMITFREHRPALTAEEALYELRLNKGKQFDPDITEAFIELLHKKGGI